MFRISRPQFLSHFRISIRPEALEILRYLNRLKAGRQKVYDHFIATFIYSRSVEHAEDFLKSHLHDGRASVHEVLELCIGPARYANAALYFRYEDVTIRVYASFQYLP